MREICSCSCFLHGQSLLVEVEGLCGLEVVAVLVLLIRAATLSGRAEDVCHVQLLRSVYDPTHFV